MSAVPQQNCTDIDECAAGTHICDVNSECINTIVSQYFLWLKFFVIKWFIFERLEIIIE